MRDVYVKLHPVLPRKSSIIQEDSYHQQLRKKKLESSTFGAQHLMVLKKMEVSWPDRRRNDKVLHTVKQDRNILHAIKRRKDNDWLHFVEQLSFKIHYRRKDKSTDRSDRKTRKKASAFTGMTLRKRQHTGN